MSYLSNRTFPIPIGVESKSSRNSTEVSAEVVIASSLRHLLFLFRSFRHFCLSRSIAVAVCVCICHLLVAVTARAFVIFVEFLANLGLRLRLEIFVDAFVIFICASAIGDFTVT